LNLEQLLQRKDLPEDVKHVIREHLEEEQKLQDIKNENWYRSILDNLDEGIVIVDLKGTIIYANKVGSVIFNYPQEQLIGQNLNDFNSCTIVKFAESLAQIRETKKCTSFDLELNQHCRYEYVLEVSSTPYFDSHGEIVTTISIFRDITKRIKVQRELEDNKRLLVNILDLVPHMIFAKNRAGEFILVNKGLAESFGKSVEEIVGRKQIDVHPIRDESAVFLKYDRKVIDENEALTVIVPFTNVHGNKRTLEVSKIPFVLPNGELGVLGIGIDITEQLDVENALRKTRDELADLVETRTKELRDEKLRLETILETTSTGIMFLDHEGNVSLYNRMFEQFWIQLYGKEIPKNMNIFRLKKDEFTSLIVELFNSDDLPPQTIEVSDNLFLQVTVARIQTDEQFIGALVEIRDVTRFLELDKLRKEFVSYVSHELRTPIASITLSAQFLKNHWRELSEINIEKTLGIMKESTEILTMLIEDLLLLSRIEEGQFKLKWKEFELITAINHVIKQLKPNIKAKSIEVVVNTPDKVLFYGDEQRIEQIFRIFIDNAIKFSEDNSSITIIVVDNYVGKYNQKKQDGVLIQIIDEGIGIKKEDIPHLFKRFYRTEEARSYPGSGLGLSIAKEMINLHEGEVFVESEYEVGSIFSIFLPRNKSRPEIQ